MTNETVLAYSRGAVAQDTYYYCGPASCQTVIRSATGQLIAESTLARKLGTHTGGTDYIGQFPKVLNEFMPTAQYRHRNMPNDPATATQKQQLWADITNSIDAGYGVVANIVAPPSNYPRSVAPSTQNLRYAGGTVYHYIAVMGYAGEGAGRRVWLADSGFPPFGAWISFDQLATLIPPKGYAYATATPKPKPRKETDMPNNRVLLGGESAGALHEAKVASKNTDETTQRIEKIVTLVADQMLGWPKDKDGNYLISGWNFDSVVEAAEKKIAAGKGITLVEQVALLQFQNQHMAEALKRANESIGYLIEAIGGKK
jgi:putative chitinase